MLHALSVRAKLFSNYLSSLPTSLFHRDIPLPIPNAEEVKNTRSNSKPNVHFNLESSNNCIHYDPSDIVIWKRPIVTLNYFTAEILVQIHLLCLYLLSYKEKSWMVFFGLASIFLLYVYNGQYEKVFEKAITPAKTYMYWLSMGILSSIGIGTGLHTFILYLAPFIAKVTMGAHECKTLSFPTPPYPENIVCPARDWFYWFTLKKPAKIEAWDISNKVRCVVFAWGLGTAIGEIPGYLLGRAARLAEPIYQRKRLSLAVEHFVDCHTGTSDIKTQIIGNHHGNSQPSEKSSNSSLGSTPSYPNLSVRKSSPNQTCKGGCEALKQMTRLIVKKLGFWGIILFSAIPNPLFDLAGLASGHGLMPFWKFFTALVIGKAFIKSQCQLAAVVLVFSQELFNYKIFKFTTHVPVISPKIHAFFITYINQQKAKIRRGKIYEGDNMRWNMGRLLEWVNILIVIYFVVNIIDSLAQANYLRNCDKTKE